MQALRVARPHAHRLVLRRLTTAAPSTSASVSASASVVIPLSNVEAQWEKLSKTEQASVHQQLEELQKRDWKSLSIDEKKAGTSSFLRALFQCWHAHPVFSFLVSLGMSGVAVYETCN